MARKYQILHLTHDMGVGGTEQVISQLVRNLDSSRFECDVACIDGEVGPLGDQLRPLGIKFHVFDRKPGFDLSLIRDIRARLKENRYHIIHCHQYTPYVYGVLAALFSGVKVVFTEHGRFHPDSYSWRRRLINPLLGWPTDSIVAISAATARALAHYEWFSAKAIEVIYNGMDAVRERGDPEQCRREFDIPTGNLVFGTIARFDPIKNIPMMIDAFDIVHRSNPASTLLLVGDGAERDRLEIQVKRLGLTDSVIFTGYRTDTSSLMSIMDVYLLSSYSEGTSMVLLEAMSTGTCSIVTRVGGNIEIIEHKSNGIVVESEDVNSLAAWMEQLAGDAELRRRLGKNGMNDFEDRFSVATMSTRYVETYDRVLGIR